MVDQTVDQPPSTAAVILAAGFSKRLQRPKQLLAVEGVTLLERAVRTARAAGLRPILPVLNALLFEDHALRAGFQSLGAHALLNGDAAEGMASSIRCGLSALSALFVSGLVVMTCDQVAVTAAHLRALCEQPNHTAASGYAGRIGVPAYFPATRIAELQSLRGDEGARALLKHARVVTTEALAIDVDTEEDWRNAQVWLKQQKHPG